MHDADEMSLRERVDSPTSLGFGVTHYKKDMRWALKEIDRLRAENELLRTDVNNNASKWVKLDTENAKLRDLLIEVDKFLQDPSIMGNGAGGHVLVVPGLMAIKIRAIVEGRTT